MTVVSVLVALLLLGILITVHEFVHYIFARMTGIEVMEFAIGFGPKIVGWTGKSGTKFAPVSYTHLTLPTNREV